MKPQQKSVWVCDSAYLVVLAGEESLVLGLALLLLLGDLPQAERLEPRIAVAHEDIVQVQEAELALVERDVVVHDTLAQHVLGRNL